MKIQHLLMALVALAGVPCGARCAEVDADSVLARTLDVLRNVHTACCRDSIKSKDLGK